MSNQQVHLEPLNDWVILTPIKQQDIVAGIIIPDKAKKKPQAGIVIAVGNGRPDMDTSKVKPGMQVLFPQHAGIEIKLEGKDMIIIKYAELFCINVI